MKHVLEDSLIRMSHGVVSLDVPLCFAGNFAAPGFGSLGGLASGLSCRLRRFGLTSDSVCC